MPRDSSGTYTLPPSNPVVDATLIETLWANPTMQDIAVQLNNVVTRDGLLGFTSPATIPDGTVAAPGLAFSAQPNTGFYRAGASTIGISLGGTNVASFLPTGVSFSIPVSTSSVFRVTNGTDSGEMYANATGLGLEAKNAKSVFFVTNSVERIRIDAMGNLGVAIPPSPWIGTIKAIQFSGGAFASAGSGPYMTQNLYNDGSWRYIANGSGNVYLQSNLAGHQWYVAPNGAAGAVATLTRAMYLDQVGNLAVGTQDPVTKLHVGGTIRVTSGADEGELYANPNGTIIEARNSKNVGFATSGLIRVVVDAGGVLRPFNDNVLSCGAAANRWTVVFAATGTINTSDARVKTELLALTPQELAASSEMAREVGAFKFLKAVEEKGDAARIHIGLTVQRAIEIMRKHGLDPFAYAFICYDAEPDVYGFRVDELNLFLAAGFDARLAALEAMMNI